jgi:hypothetical protein
MKKTVLILALMVALIASGCSVEKHEEVEKNNNGEKEVKTVQEISSEEMKKIDLYVTVMKAAFKEENGGSSFLAVEMDTLEGLSDKGKQEVLNKLKDISENVYPFKDVKDDDTKFKQDKNGSLVGSIDGTLLSVKIKEMSDNKAIIVATSWFGNLGAVFPEYKATYENGKWNLELLSMGIS